MPQKYKYCPMCAAELAARLLGERERLVCDACGFIFWQNPIVGAAVIVLDDNNRLLLGRRSRGVYAGKWCIPCGYVEHDEHVREAAARELLEETGLIVRIGETYTAHSNFHNPKVPTVGIWFRGYVTGGSLQAADDLDAVEYVSLDDLAAYPLAFPTDELVVAQLRDTLRDTLGLA